MGAACVRKTCHGFHEFCSGEGMATKPKAALEDLYGVDGKAELVNGDLVIMEPAGDSHNRAAGAVYISLRGYERKKAVGRAFSDNAGFRVHLPNRGSFCPDAAFHTGARTGMKFLEGAPVFAVEVRSDGDYGPAAEKKMAAKRADYFAAGTLVVWDVDLLADDVVRVYRSSDPENPAIYRRGETAEAEP